MLLAAISFVANSFAAISRDPCRILRHSRERGNPVPNTPSFPRTRESSVFASTPLGPRVRGDDEATVGLSPRTRESSVFASTPLGPRVRGDDEATVGLSRFAQG